MTSPPTMADPSTTYVFIVGNNAEWDEDRAEMGDKQMHHCFQQFGISSPNNMIFIKDDDCTKDNCERELQKMLQRTKPNDTLVFHYGGHGIKKGFCTKGKTWRYCAAINLIEKQFRGDKVWCLIDCCFSGAFDHHIPPETAKSWLCLMSSDASIEAGEEWSMTDCFSKAMRGRLLRQREDISSSNGGKRLSSKSRDVLTTQNMVEIMADHHAIIKNDCLQATLYGKGIDPTAPFPFRIPDEKMSKNDDNIIGVTALFVSSLFVGKPDVGIKEADNAVPVDAIKWKRMIGLSKGDRIYAKWHGGSPPTSLVACPYLLPAWYHATLISDVDWSNAAQTVEVEFQQEGHCWNSVVSFHHDVVPASYVEISFQDYCKAHKKLAEYGRYLDATVKPGTKVWAFYENDGKVYTAYIQQENDREWQHVKNRIMTRAMYLPYYGPFLWAEWEGEDDWTLLPKSHCIVQTSETQAKPTIHELRQQARQPTDHTMTAKQAMVKGMETMGKKLVLEPRQVLGYWNGKWYDAVVSKKVPPVKVLAEHLHFENISGNYYCVQWKKDETLCILPERLVRSIEENPAN